FQAEDGIRDRNVTGVQTCALPIFLYSNDGPLTIKRIALLLSHGDYNHRWYDVAKKICQRLLSRGLLVRLKGEYAIADKILALLRSEERRVGKECGSRWTRDGRTEK